MGYGFVGTTEKFILIFIPTTFIFLVLFLIALAITRSAATAGKTCGVFFGFLLCAIPVLRKLPNLANSVDGFTALLLTFMLFVILCFLFKSKRKL